MTKRITASQAYQASNRPNVFEVKETAKIGEIVKLVKVLLGRGHKIATAAPIAKRAYKLGIRCQ